jgi:hypothetical protein
VLWLSRSILTDAGILCDKAAKIRDMMKGKPVYDNASWDYRVRHLKVAPTWQSVIE